jgi:hypothetical protein
MAVVAGLGIFVARWAGLPILIVVLAALLTYLAGLLVGVLPPGRPPPPSTRDDISTHDTEPIWPYVVPPAQPPPRPPPPSHQRTWPPQEERRRDYGFDDAGEGASWAAWTLAILILGVAAGGTALLTIALGAGGNSDPPAAPSPEDTAEPASLANTPTPSPVPPTSTATLTSTATPTETATPTPTPRSPTPTRTPRPPTATATVTPTDTPEATQTPAPGRRSSRNESASLTGRWLLVDIVSFGPDAGRTYTFTITLSHTGDRVTGGGDGIALEGSLDGQVLTLTYTRTNGEGVFVWSMLSNNLLVGDFRDHTAQNGGPSTLTRLS